MPQRTTHIEITLPRTVVGDKEPYSLVQYQVHVTMEVTQITAVANDVESVTIFFVKTQSHGVDGGIHTKLARVHHLRCLRLQDASIAVPAVLQMGDHECGHVGTHD